MPIALVINADSSADSVVRQALSQYGFGVYGVESDKEAFCAFAEIRPDLVLFNFKGQKDGWQVFAEMRLDNDVPMILLTDQSVPAAYKDRVDGNTRILKPPVSAEQVISMAMRMGNFSPHTIQLLNSPVCEKIEAVRLCMLSPRQVRAIDRALNEVGEFGEVRLTVQRGHVRFLVKVISENLVEE